MRINNIKAVLETSVCGLAVLLAGVGIAGAQQQINLTAGPTNAVLPDGSSVPMWGYSCGAVVSGSTATCAALNPMAGGNWSPVIITVPTGAGLTINLSNQLPAPVPTSLVIVGQLGGGLGDKTQRTTQPSPLHDNQGTTWPIANSGAVFTHPSIQGPMGLYGMLVVTCAPGSTNCSSPGSAYPNITYAAEVPLLMSEIDPVQNRAVNAAVKTAGFSESATFGPYTGGAVASINLTSGGSGYTSTPTVSFVGGGGSGATATAIVDTTAGSPTFHQVVEIDIANGGTYSTAPKITISGGGGTGAAATAALQLNPNGLSHCSGGAAACYPPVVNYTPLYYLFNGIAFNKTNASASLFATNPSLAVTGNVLVRFVNAGLRMHVPTIVGSQTGTAVSPAVPPGGFSLIAEDGNPVPGTVPRVQSEVFMAAGKTYDVMINAPASGTALPVFDRELSLSGNSTLRDGGMLAYISVNGAGLPGAGALGAAKANPDIYKSVVAGQTLTASDPSLGVMANDVNVYGVKVVGTAPAGLTLNENGTFTYTAGVPASFTYCGNGATAGAACATVTLGAAPIEAGGNIKLGNDAFTSNLSRTLSIKAPGILANDTDTAGYPLKVVTSSVSAQSGLTIVADQHGGFDASLASPCMGAPCTYTFTYKAQNSQGTQSASAATVSITFGPKNGPTIQLLDGATKSVLTGMDYRWVVEEDRTFYVDPTKTTNTGTPGSTSAAAFGTNFHTSYMPLIAQGCTGQGSVSCGAGQTVRGQDAPTQTPADPSELHLDTTKRYYISVLPGDAANPFNAGNGSACLATTDPNYDASACGHGMGGASLFWNGSAWVSPTAPTQSTVSVLVEPAPLPSSKLTVFVFEDDFPLNGEQDAGGGVEILAPNEPGLGGFNITVFDDAGGTGDATGQVDYDMFNQPLSNSLAGTIDPPTKLDACPISPKNGSRTGTLPNGKPDSTQTGIAGVVVTCPKYESDGNTLSPLAGQAVIANMMPGRYGVVATPGADRIARNEEWLQTNTLDGQKAHDSFLKVGEPAFFQEYGPANFHVAIGSPIPPSSMAA
jgi:Bacterial Ig domain